jgi:hypothetical protein
MLARSRRSRSGHRFLVFALTGLAALLAAGSGFALEGIQGQYGIFYPSVELVFYHTDNLFLTPDGETDSNEFIVRPQFWFEIPTDRHYFSFKYRPQFRDVEEYDLGEQFSHFVDIDGKFQGSPVFRVEVANRFARGVLETQEVDPDGELVVGLDPFMKNDFRLDFIWEGKIQGFDFYGRWLTTDFDRDDPVSTEPMPAFLEQSSLTGGFEYFYKFTPLSRFFIGYEFTASDEDFSDGLQYDSTGQFPVGGQTLGLASLDSDTNRLHLGFEGELGRTSTGRIMIGFKDVNFDNAPESVSDFTGMVADGTWTKAFTRFTKLELNVRRDENFSNFSGNAFYRANRVGFALTNQPLGRKVFWTIAGYFQRNSYPDPVDVGGGEMRHREDDTIVGRAEVGYFPIPHLNVKLNFQHQERQSNMPMNAFDFEENVVLFQLGLGY